ncbi:MAG: carbohydrate ABC transporter permease [Oscillospiraceae bacterium]|nr:carbohydrate ABC transporter permease [Oscillospiraceae bacterium]
MTPDRNTAHKKARKKIHLKRRQQKILTVIMTVFAAAAAIIFLMPTILTIANSFMDSAEISANYGAVFSTTESGGKTYISEKINLKFIPDMVSFSQYYTVLFKSPDYLLKFWNSVILVVPIVIFQLIIAAFAAYGFARLKGRLKEIIFFVYIIVMLMPYQVTLVPNYLVSDKLGILNTRWAIILPAIFTPFSVFLLTKIMRRIPIALIEAAKLDGAGEMQIFRYIALPLCKSVMYSVVILVFIDYWNMVEQPLILLSDTSLYPLSVFLSQINSGEIGLAFAVASIYMIPTLLMFLYGEDYLVEGITYSGGIKG